MKRSCIFVVCIFLHKAEMTEMWQFYLIGGAMSAISFLGVFGAKKQMTCALKMVEKNNLCNVSNICRSFYIHRLFFPIPTVNAKRQI